MVTLLFARVLKAVRVTLTDTFLAGSGERKETVSKSMNLLPFRILKKIG